MYSDDFWPNLRSRFRYATCVSASVQVNTHAVTRSELAASIRTAEVECAKASKALTVLRKLVDAVAQLSGKPDETIAGDELAAHVADLTQLEKPALKAWTAACSRDPLIAHLLAARPSYMRTDDRRGKSAKKLEVEIAISFQGALQRGFAGSRRDWEALLRLR